MKIHPAQDFLHDFAADIFKIDVNAFGSGAGELFLPVRMLVVDGGIETKILGDPGALVIRAGNPNDAAAVNFSNLPGDAAGSASGGGDDKGFALLRRRDFHTEQSGEAVHAEQADADGGGIDRNLRVCVDELMR